MSNYIVEAFKAMSLLESEDISLNADGFDKLEGFMDEAGVDPDEEMTDVFDLEAEAQDELKQSYIGKVVLECSVCHSDIFVDKSEVSVGTDEEGLACYDIECPYCMSNEGYTIIGEVAPFNQEESDALKNPDEAELPVEEEMPDVDIEGGADDIDEEDLEESLQESVEPELKGDGVEELYDNQEIRGVEELKGDEKLEGDDAIRGPLHKTHVNEAYDVEFEREYDEILDDPSMSEAEKKVAISKLCKAYGMNESLVLESFSATINTDDQSIDISSEDDGSVSVNATPAGEAPVEEPMMGDLFGGEEEFGGDEMIAPLESDTIDEVEAAADANSIEEGEDNIEFTDLEGDDMGSEEDFMDFDDFDEESFNGLGESYLRECYENVTGFKTTGISIDGKKLMIEGMIKFDSGNIKETEFVFESVGNGKFEGFNKQISKGKKTFKLTTLKEAKKLVCEALNYNYRSKNELNESVRVYGTVKRK